MPMHAYITRRFLKERSWTFLGFPLSGSFRIVPGLSTLFKFFRASWSFGSRITGSRLKLNLQGQNLKLFGKIAWSITFTVTLDVKKNGLDNLVKVTVKVTVTVMVKVTVRVRVKVTLNVTVRVMRYIICDDASNAYIKYCNGSRDAWPKL